MSPLLTQISWTNNLLTFDTNSITYKDILECAIAISCKKFFEKAYKEYDKYIKNQLRQAKKII